MVRSWQGPPPDKCDLCDKPLTQAFVDGMTTVGPWAMMCLSCHKKYGFGLGTGRGQKYVHGLGKWLKVREDK